MTATNDLSIELPVAVPEDALRAAIAQVEAWWSTTVERSDDEFTIHFDHNWTRVRTDGTRWTVVAQDTPHMPIADEWVGNALTFEVMAGENGTSSLRFTHHDLMPQQCAEGCLPAWRYYINSLVSLAETGKGQPFDPTQGGRA